MEETIFDKILAGTIPSDRVFEDDYVLAFRDVSPQAPVHVLVIPKKKAVDFTALKDRTDEEVGRFFKRVALVAEKLGLPEKGYRIVINNGKFGQQTVAYLHAHILGERQMNWPPG